MTRYSEPKTSGLFFIKAHAKTSAARPGIALILVIAATALATIMGLAILGTSSLHAAASRNQTAALRAEYLAESGLELGLYYLQNPNAAPNRGSDGLYNGTAPGQTLSVSPDDSGRIDAIEVQKLGSGKYAVTARATSADGITREARATVHMPSKYEVRHALAVNSPNGTNFTIPTAMSITGPTGVTLVRSDGPLTVLGSVIGTVLSPLITGISGSRPPAFPVTAAPKLDDLTLARELKNSISTAPQYTYNGRTYKAKLLSSNPTGGTLLDSDTTNNPANVWYTTTTRTFSGNVSLPGSLVALGNSTDLRLNGSLTITPKEGMPAMIVQRNLHVLGSGRNLRATGVSWIGEGITSDLLLGLGSRLEFNGAMMLGGNEPNINTLFSGEIRVAFVSAAVSVPTLSEVGATPGPIRILSWER